MATIPKGGNQCCVVTLLQENHFHIKLNLHDKRNKNEKNYAWLTNVQLFLDEQI